MRERSSVNLLFLLLTLILFNAACAQTPGQAYVTEERLAEKSTVLFNNDKYHHCLLKVDVEIYF